MNALNPEARLSFTHLHFEVRAEERMSLGGVQAGERLRNALAAVMLRANCAQTGRGQRPSAAHAAECPVCWLLAAQDEAGLVRRVYCLAPPIPAAEVVQAGERFVFTVTLFGKGVEYLPYFVLAIPAMGQAGVGPGRGRFEVEQAWTENPLTGERQTVLAAGEQVVNLPSLRVSLEAAQRTAAETWQAGRQEVVVDFLTPLRLIEAKQLVRQPDFGVFFRRLLERMDELAVQTCEASPRSKAEVERLYGLADRVRLVDGQVEWVDFFTYSGRKSGRTPMGGLRGWARYRGGELEELLPWLMLGQGVQAGKLAVKGNGVYEVRRKAGGYWARQPGGEKAAG